MQNLLTQQSCRASLAEEHIFNKNHLTFLMGAAENIQINDACRFIKSNILYLSNLFI